MVGWSQVTVGSRELKANHMIKQTFVFPEEAAKYTQLIKLLGKEMDGSRLLVLPLPALLVSARTNRRLSAYTAIQLHQ